MSKELDVVAIIQARMGASRLPGKVFIRLDGPHSMHRIVRRLRAVNALEPGLIGKVVVAIPDTPEDIKLFRWCNNKSVSCYVGKGLEPNDVLGRYAAAAREYKAKWILRITADCPLLEPLMIYGLLKKQPRKDYQALAVNRRAIPLGWDAELFSYELLECTDKRVTAPDQREHVTLAMRGPGADAEDYGTPFDFSGIKFDLDTPEDVKRIKRYVRYL